MESEPQLTFFSLRLEGIFKGKIEPNMLLFLALRDRFRLAPINPQVGRRHKSIGVKRMVFWEQLEKEVVWEEGPYGQFGGMMGSIRFSYAFNEGTVPGSHLRKGSLSRLRVEFFVKSTEFLLNSKLCKCHHV